MKIVSIFQTNLRDFSIEERMITFWLTNLFLRWSINIKTFRITKQRFMLLRITANNKRVQRFFFY